MVQTFKEIMSSLSCMVFFRRPAVQTILFFNRPIINSSLTSKAINTNVCGTNKWFFILLKEISNNSRLFFFINSRHHAIVVQAYLKNVCVSIIATQRQSVQSFKYIDMEKIRTSTMRWVTHLRKAGSALKKKPIGHTRSARENIDKVCLWTGLREFISTVARTLSMFSGARGDL